MATCLNIPLEPISPPSPAKRTIEAIFLPMPPSMEDDNSDAVWPPRPAVVEQTEPLNLCLNVEVMKQLSNGAQEVVLEGNEADDDVIFVKEMRTADAEGVGRRKTEALKRGPGGQKNAPKELPRRNPVRRARANKRFREYEASFEDEEDFFPEGQMEELESSPQKSTSPDVDFTPPAAVQKNLEDSEEWNAQQEIKQKRRVPQQPQNKRKVLNKSTKQPRTGRRRKFNNNLSKIREEIEELVPLNDLEDLFVSNLLLVKDYFSVVRNSRGKDSERSKSALELFKRQAVLLGVVKDITSVETLQFV